MRSKHNEVIYVFSGKYILQPPSNSSMSQQNREHNCIHQMQHYKNQIFEWQKWIIFILNWYAWVLSIPPCILFIVFISFESKIRGNRCRCNLALTSILWMGPLHKLHDGRREPIDVVVRLVCRRVLCPMHRRLIPPMSLLLVHPSAYRLHFSNDFRYRGGAYGTTIVL